jgi:hypothetical protein
LITDFFAFIPARWALAFAFFGIARFAAILRTGLVLALPRFERFLRIATRFFALPWPSPVRRAARTLPYLESIRHSTVTIRGVESK